MRLNSTDTFIITFTEKRFRINCFLSSLSKTEVFYITEILRRCLKSSDPQSNSCFTLQNIFFNPFYTPNTLLIPYVGRWRFVSHSFAIPRKTYMKNKPPPTSVNFSLFLLLRCFHRLVKFQRKEWVKCLKYEKESETRI